MLVKRFLLVVISLAVGFGVTWAVVNASFIAGSNLEEFGFTYTFFTTLSLAIAVGIWLDKFMGTEILQK